MSSQLFSDEKKAHLQSPLTTLAHKQAWLAHVTAVRQYISRRAHCPVGLRKMQQNLRHFLQSK